MRAPIVAPAKAGAHLATDEMLKVNGATMAALAALATSRLYPDHPAGGTMGPGLRRDDE